MNDLDRYAVSLENMEVLRAQVEAQAREIERLSDRNCAVEDELARTLDYRALWVEASKELAALKAQPSGVVPDWLTSSRAFVDRLYAAGWRDHADAQHAGAAGMYDELIAHLNQPVSAGDERAGWTEKKPTEEGAYWIRGNGLEADALVQVKQEEGELWCNLHMRNSEPVFEYGYAIEQLSSEFEWLGPLQARAALSANHSEQVREALADLLECPASVVQATVPRAGIEVAPPYQVVLDVSVSLTRWRKAQAALKAVAPSAGSQKEQGE